MRGLQFRPMPGLTWLSTLILLGFGASGLSACATRLGPLPTEITVSDTLRAPCLRGRLPAIDDGLTVGEALEFGVAAESSTTCEASRASGLIAIIDDHNAAIRERR